MPIYDLNRIYDHSHEGEIPVLEINMDDELNEIAMLSNSGTKLLTSSSKVMVYGSEGKNYPHFHFIAPGIDCCIMLHDTRYFTHGSHKGIITDGKTRKLLNKWLETVCVNDNRKALININGLLMWSALVKYWNYANNYNLKYDPEIKLTKLDYSNIKPF